MMHTRVLINKSDMNSPFTVEDRIFLGEGLFETLKVTSSKPYVAHLHWQRLSDSAKKLGIPFDLSLEDWQDHLIAQIKRDNLYHGGIKAILSGGTAPRGLAEQGQVSQLIFQTFNYTPNYDPIRLCSASWKRDAANPIYSVKSINYLEAIMARRQALIAGADDALFYNTDLHATETTCANLFIIQNNTLLTPPLEDGVLPGITRGRLLNLAEQLHIPYQQQSLTNTLLKEADIAFTTNSLQGIRLILSLDDITFNLDHPLLQELLHLLADE